MTASTGAERAGELELLLASPRRPDRGAGAPGDWIAAVPTPPAAAVTSTRAPGPTRACRVSGIQAVRNAVRKAAPSAKLALAAGRRATRRRPSTRSAYPPPASSGRTRARGGRRPRRRPRCRARRQRRRLRVVAEPDQDVGEVDPGGADVDERPGPRPRSGSGTSSTEQLARRPRAGRRPHLPAREAGARASRGTRPRPRRRPRSRGSGRSRRPRARSPSSSGRSRVVRASSRITPTACGERAAIVARERRAPRSISSLARHDLARRGPTRRPSRAEISRRSG